jgi:hypothetical protein
MILRGISLTWAFVWLVAIRPHSFVQLHSCLPESVPTLLPVVSHVRLLLVGRLPQWHRHPLAEQNAPCRRIALDRLSDEYTISRDSGLVARVQ